LRLVAGTQLRNASDAFQFAGEPAMAAQAQVKPDFDGAGDRQLADDIARAMRHRPLMSRLGRVDAVNAKTPAAAARVLPLAAVADAAEPPPVAADPRSIEEVIDDLGYTASPPPSAQWLDTARRAHRAERRRHAIAWVTTLGIAGAIVASASLLLRI
jgi:hypothetical protein